MRGSAAAAGLLLVCAIVGLLETVPGSLAADHAKWKTCKDSSFCTRSRQLSSSTTQSAVEVVASVGAPPTIRSGEEHKGEKGTRGEGFEGRVLSQIGVELPFSMRVYHPGVLRVKVWEDHKKRYQGPQEVILPDLETLPFTSWSNITDSSGLSSVFSFSTADGDVVTGALHYKPFSIELSVNGRPTFHVNSRGLFNFEHTRDGKGELYIKDPSASKPDLWDDESDGLWEAPLIKNPTIEGKWEEKFGGKEDTKPNGPQDVGCDISFIGSENVFGIPEHASDFVLKRTANSDPYRLFNVDVFEYELDNLMALYGSVPFMIGHSATHTSAIFWFNSAETWVDISDRSGKGGGINTHWFSASGCIDIWLMVGPKPRDIFKQFAAVVGTSFLPPLWSLGYHQSKWNYRSQSEVMEVDKRMDDVSVPLDVIWLDIEHTDGKKYFTWDKIHFPKPLEMQKALQTKGRYMVAAIDPHIKKESGYFVHEKALKDNVYVKDCNGNILEGTCWPGMSSWIDFLNPRARKWWADLFSFSTYQGSSSSLYAWNDMNEPTVMDHAEATMPNDALHYTSLEHRNVHNVYGFYMTMATYDGLLHRDKQNLRPFILTRSHFAASQRYAAVWTGDNKAEWSHLKATTSMLLSLSVAGIPFVGCDIGGFFGNPEPELLVRWYQAAFYPFFRAHGHIDSRRREPFLYDGVFLSAIQTAIAERYVLLPYWYTNFFEHTKTGLPLLRPIWLEFPQDKDIFLEQEAFIVGDALLVKPVTKAGERSTMIRIPCGNEDTLPSTSSSSAKCAKRCGGITWYTFPTYSWGACGGSWVNAPSQMDVGPVVLHRSGTIVPVSARVRRSAYSEMLLGQGKLALIVALGESQSAAGSLYLDDGTTFAYQRGKSLYSKFSFSAGTLTCTVVGAENSTESIRSEPWANTHIERIVFAGLPKCPASVSYTPIIPAADPQQTLPGTCADSQFCTIPSSPPTTQPSGGRNIDFTCGNSAPFIASLSNLQSTNKPKLPPGTHTPLVVELHNTRLSPSSQWSIAITF